MTLQIWQAIILLETTMAGVTNPQATAHYLAGACSELGHGSRRVCLRTQLHLHTQRTGEHGTISSLPHPASAQSRKDWRPLDYGFPLIQQEQQQQQQIKNPLATHDVISNQYPSIF